jgi:hypothetical protein
MVEKTARTPAIPCRFLSTPPRWRNIPSFRVELRHHPHFGEVVDCVFVVDGALFQNFRATVRWVMDNEVLEASCSVGFSVEVGEDRKGEFLAALSGVFDFMDEAP